MALNLSERYLVGELMDDPSLPEKDHHQALRGLQRVNSLSRTASHVAAAIQRHFRHSAPQSLRILDIACGGGDVTLNVARQLRRAGMDASITGWDCSPTAVQFAQRQAADHRVDGVHFELADALATSSTQTFDVVYCTLFLHHLTNDQAEKLLSSMWRLATRLVIIDDLRRSKLGYLLAIVGCRLLSRSPIVHVDGPLSVRAAFTDAEIVSLSDRCQLPRPSIHHHWPHRFLLSWAAP